MFKNLLKQTFVCVFIVASAIFLFACSKYSVLAPTAEFYINDSARALLQPTKWNIFLNSEDLYDYSLEKEGVLDEIRGAQVVVVTHFKKEGEVFDNTTLFNEWGIGKNDMGLLFVLEFTQGEELPEFESITFEIGAQMMGHLSAMKMSSLASDYFFTHSDYDLGLMHLYFETLRFIYTQVYGAANFTYDLDYYQEIMYDFHTPLPSETTTPGLFNFAEIPTWGIILIVIGFSFLGLGLPGFYFLTTRSGGGGKSLGYWFSKRK